MITIRAANDDLIDYTTTLEFLCGDMIAEGCSVILDERQYPILLSYLEKIAAIGDINFRLEMCIDHRPGYSVSWDNDGSPEQDNAVDRLMGELVQSLGFEAGSIRNPSVITDPAAILNAVHLQDAAMAILDKIPDAEPEEWDRMPDGFVSDADDILTDDPDPPVSVTKYMIRKQAEEYGWSAEHIAKLYRLDLDFVRKEIEASKPSDGT